MKQNHNYVILAYFHHFLCLPSFFFFVHNNDSVLILVWTLFIQVLAHYILNLVNFGCVFNSVYIGLDIVYIGVTTLHIKFRLIFGCVFNILFIKYSFWLLIQSFERHKTFLSCLFSSDGNLLACAGQEDKGEYNI
jgi:hypothetical protein